MADINLASREDAGEPSDSASWEFRSMALRWGRLDLTQL